jgi:peptidoglycan/LPS O-acetylase OafA/YrhL
VALRDRLRRFLAPEAAPEPLIRYRRGVPALRSFGVFLLLLAPLGGTLFALADSDGPPLWVVPLTIGLAAFACAFLLPRRRRRIVAVIIGTLTATAMACVLVIVVLLLIAEANCPPDAYECPF